MYFWVNYSFKLTVTFVSTVQGTKPDLHSLVELLERSVGEKVKHHSWLSFPSSSLNVNEIVSHV